MNSLYFLIPVMVLLLVIGIVIGVRVPESPKRNISLAGLGVLLVVLLIVAILTRSKSTTPPHKPPPHPPGPKPKAFAYKNKGLKPPPAAGIGALDGFGNKVDWWFLIKLPAKMMEPSQAQHARLLPKDYLPNKPYGIYDDTQGFKNDANFTKGYITAGLGPSLGFIQQWAPYEDHYIRGEFTIQPKSALTFAQLAPIIQEWLGLADSSLMSLNSYGEFTLTTPKSDSWNKNVSDPSDKVASVNLFRAWLRIKQALNYNETTTIKDGKYTDDYTDITSNLTGLPVNTKVLLKSYVTSMGNMYDYANCGMSQGAAGHPMVDYGGGVARCAHCVCDGNNLDNVYSDLPCTRVSDTKGLFNNNYLSGKPIKCWNKTDYAKLLTMVQAQVKSKKYPLDKISKNYAQCLSNYLMASLPGGTLDKATVTKNCDSTNKILQTYYDKSGKGLYDPAAFPCFAAKPKKKSSGEPGKEKYSKNVPKPPPIQAFPRGPQCQSALDKDSPVNYFFPDWAKDENGIAIAYAQNRIKRGSGVCYVYADSHSPKPRFFRSVTSKDGKTRLDPLGQGGNDPVSKTLNQLFDSYRNPSVHWSFWTDQMYEPGDSYVGSAHGKNGKKPKGFADAVFDAQNPYKNPLPGDGREAGTIYSHKGAGCSAPGAHSKGVVCASGEDGFWMSTSIPMYPDFSFAGIGEHIKLGCQLDNNANFAQHMFCCSMNSDAIQTMLLRLQEIMACSLQSPTCKVNSFGGFNYGYGLDGNYVTEKGKRLNMYQCSSVQGPNQGFPPAGSTTPSDETWYREIEDSGAFRFHPDGKSAAIVLKTNAAKPVNITVISKVPADTRPPWAIVANFLQSDLTVTGWWDNLNGTPSYCAGRDYSQATNQLCLNSYKEDIEKVTACKPSKTTSEGQPCSLLDKNSPKYNVERIMSLTVHDIPNPMSSGKVMSRTFMQYGKLWYVGNHAKWGISSPRTSTTEDPYWVVFGDMNGGGYPASKQCNSNQFGRGGLFFAIQNKDLHDALVEMIEMVCACNSAGDESKNFCGWGGYPGELNDLGVSEDPTYGRVDAWDRFAILPSGASTGTYWDKKFAGKSANKPPVAWTRWISPAGCCGPSSTADGVCGTITEESKCNDSVKDSKGNMAGCYWEPKGCFQPPPSK